MSVQNNGTGKSPACALECILGSINGKMNGTMKNVGWTESGISLKLTRSSGRKTGALWRRCQPPRPYFRENSPRAPRFAPQLPNYFTLESNQSISNKPLPFIDQWSSHSLLTSLWMAAYSFHYSESDLLSCMLLMHYAECWEL